MTRIRCQKGILSLRVEPCRILNFLFQIRGVDIFQLSYFSIDGGWYLSVVIFLYWYKFFRETFMVKFSYNNIKIFHLKILNLICQRNCTIHCFDIPTSLAHSTGCHFWAKLYKIPFLFIALTAGLYLFTCMYINTWYWSVVSSEPDRVQSWSKSRLTFNVCLLLIS